MAFENNIKKWVLVDNEIKKMNEQIKDLRNKRNEYQQEIYNYVTDNQLENATIQINDGKLKFNEIKQTSPLTIKFIKECLMEIIDSDEQVEQIINHIKERRNVKYIKDIRRLYNKN